MHFVPLSKLDFVSMGSCLAYTCGREAMCNVARHEIRETGWPRACGWLELILVGFGKVGAIVSKCRVGGRVLSK